MSSYNPSNSFFKNSSYLSDLPPWERSQQRLDEIELTDEFFKNDMGCYRWSNIRNAYFNDFIDVDRVVDVFRKWRDQKEYLWLEGFDESGDSVASCFVKAAKRGNDVYRGRLKEKFSFLDSLDPIYFFLDGDKKKCSPMLFVTLTVDPKKYSRDQAWSCISDKLHEFESKLGQKYSKYKCLKCGYSWIGRKKCPKCVEKYGAKKVYLKDIKRVGGFVKFRVWEAHESGYPHVHVVYFFLHKWFKVFEYNEKYRIVTKHKNSISKMWDMGRKRFNKDKNKMEYLGVDIQAVQDTHGALSEVKKYITKNVWSDKGDLTNAMVCLFNKQMYSLSRLDPFKKQLRYFEKHGIDNWREMEGIFLSKLKQWAKKDFVCAIWGSQIYLQFYKNRGGLAEPNATYLVKRSMHNCNNEFPEIVEWRFVGTVLWSDLRYFMPKIDEGWSIVVDPPPKLAGFLGLYDRFEGFEECGVCD